MKISKSAGPTSALLLAAALCSPAQAGSFKINGSTFTVPDGFVVELVAGPPLVDRPVSADFDEQGRLYVTDSSGSNDAPEKQLAAKPHRVVRLEDTDGDGRFDKSTVFADKLMFPEGALWHAGSLYVGAPPSIWKFTETNGGGIADRREEWFQGKTLTGCANDLHGPYLGLDGWLYWGKGAFAQQTYERPGKAPFVTRAAHIFRCRPDGTDFEPVLTGGMDNPVGVAFTPTGERILSGTFFQNPAGGHRDGLIHAVYGGVYGKVNEVTDEHPHTGDLLPVMTHYGAAAPCGIARYTAEAFGPEYRDNIFTCCFNLHRVKRAVLVPEGATFKTLDSDFLASDDPDFHPTGVLEDADGSLIVLNTGGWYKLCCPTSQLAKPDVLGAIYRIRRAGAAKLDDARGLKISWASLTPDELVKLLEDRRPPVRNRAIAQLAAQGDRAVAALARTSAGAGSAEGRRNALWTLTRIALPAARVAVREAVADPDNTVRHVAAQSISLWRDQGGFGGLVRLLKDPDLQVRRCAAEGLGRLGIPAAVEPVLDAAAQPGADSRMLEHSLVFALIEIGDRGATRRGLTRENSRARRAALIALDQMPHGGLEAGTVTPLLGAADPVLEETANWIISRHHDWGRALAEFLAGRLKAGPPGPVEAALLQAQLGAQAKDEGIQSLLAGSLAEASTAKPTRLLCLRAMARAHLKSTPPAWIHEVTATLHSSDPELMADGIAAARAFSAARNERTELDRALGEIGGNAALPVETRLAALAAAGPVNPLPAELFTFLLGSAEVTQPWTVRNLAATVLSRARLDRTQLLELAARLGSVGPAEVSKLLNPFEGCTDEAAGLALVQNLLTAKAASALKPDMVRPKIAKFPETVQEKARQLFQLLSQDAAQQKEHLDELLKQMPPGDIRRGQAVFNSPRVACASCHAIGYLGGQVGPDLTNIGTVRTERDLLESIVYPSASFVRSFEPVVVVTKAGDDYSGVLRKDAADEVVLVTGPGAEQRIPRSTIADMHPGTVSIMPQGLDGQLTRQELADLLAFLKGTKWGAR